MKKKSITVFLALVLGIFGIHRFYLGQRWRGIAHILIWAIIFIYQLSHGYDYLNINPIIKTAVFIAPFAIAIIDVFVFMFMSSKEFRAKYQLQDLKYMTSFEKQEALAKNQQQLSASTSPMEEDFSALISEDVQEKIAKYGRMYEEELLTKEEFLALKKSIMK